MTNEQNPAGFDAWGNETFTEHVPQAPTVEVQAALEKLEMALRFQRNGITVTGDEGVEYMLALRTLRLAAGVQKSDSAYATDRAGADLQALPSGAPAVREAGSRTPQDYAIEHAEYMATNADTLLERIEALSAAELRREEHDDDDGTVADARDDVWSAVRSLRSGIYEFRKRRDRAALTQAAPWQMLTDEEVADLEPWPACGDTFMTRVAKLSPYARAVQQAFIKKNSAPPAPEATPNTATKKD